MRRAGVVALLVLTCSAAPTVAETSADAFHALLEPEGAVLSTGTLSSALSYDASFFLKPGPPVSSLGSILDAERVQFTIFEQRRTSFVTGTMDPLSHAWVGRESFDLVRPSVTVRSHGNDSWWVGHPSATHPLRVTPSSTCAIQPEASEGPAHPAVTMVGSGLGWGSMHYLYAECRIDGFALVGESKVFAYGSTIMIHGLDFGSGVDRVLNVTTGVSRRPHPTLPLAEEIVFRILGIFPEGQGALRFNATEKQALDVQIHSTHFGVLGELSIPPGPGFLSVGGASHSPAPESMVDGLFVLDAPQPRAVRIQGTTTQAQVAQPRLQQTESAFAAVVGGVAMLALVAALIHVGLGLFSRITGPRALDHLRRRSIHELVCAEPGVSLQEVADRLGYPRRIVTYHLDVLRRQGLIQIEPYGRRRLLFAAEAAHLSPTERRRLFRMRDERYQRLLHLVRERPAASQTEIARELGISQSHVSRLLRELSRLEMLQAGHGSA